MLEYGLPPTPNPEWRWYITKGSTPDIRYLNLQKPKGFRSGRYVEVHRDMINSYVAQNEGFEVAVRKSAHHILREFTENFNWPTGEVR